MFSMLIKIENVKEKRVSVSGSYLCIDGQVPILMSKG